MRAGAGSQGEQGSLRTYREWLRVQKPLLGTFGKRS